MSLLGSMRTGVSGMNAQSVRIGSVSENIANSSTTGYKKSSVEFESIIGNSIGGGYSPGSVATHLRYGIDQQGSIASTASATDLAIDGDGFFVVNNSAGEQLLTRSGSFVLDSSGQLVNASGHYLMGYARATDGAPSPSLRTRVTLPSADLQAIASTSGSFAANLPAQATIVPSAQRPALNVADAAWSAKSSLVAYDNLGAPVTLDLYFSRTGEGAWEASIFSRADATAGSFPYASGPIYTGALQFDGFGRLTSGGNVDVDIPNGSSLALDLSGMEQLASPFAVLASQMDGNPPARPERLEIGSDGAVTTIYANGRRLPSFDIPLANVPSPAQLRPTDGNAYGETSGSGVVRIGGANEGGFGKIVSGAIESSTVDIAGELTNMIEAQRNFTANSRVFQTSSELLDVLNRL